MYIYIDCAAGIITTKVIIYNVASLGRIALYIRMIQKDKPLNDYTRKMQKDRERWRNQLVKCEKSLKTVTNM